MSLTNGSGKRTVSVFMLRKTCLERRRGPEARRAPRLARATHLERDRTIDEVVVHHGFTAAEYLYAIAHHCVELRHATAVADRDALTHRVVDEAVVADFTRQIVVRDSINAIPVGAPVGARRLFRVALRAGLRAVMGVSHEVGRESDDEMIAPLGAAAPRSARGRLAARRPPLVFYEVTMATSSCVSSASPGVIARRPGVFRLDARPAGPLCD